jgi:hypothetical protein
MWVIAKFGEGKNMIQRTFHVEDLEEIKKDERT